jgi:NAD-dependent deacetylase
MGTFRDKGGLWSRYDLNEVATPEGFARDPAKVLGFYDMRRRGMVEALPNAAHAALARLEREIGDRLFLCTQNIDDLHEQAGSRRVVHMHGELFRARCLACEAVHEWRGDLSLASACPACGAAGRMRPNVVWFGEMPVHMEAIYDALLDADLFVAVGTSGAVYPAAGFVAEARAAGIRTLEINLEPADNGRVFDERIYGPATETVPRWVESVLA